MIDGSTRPTRVLLNALSLTHGGGRAYVVNLIRELRSDPRQCQFTVLAVRDQLEADERGAVRIETIRLPASPAVLRLAARVFYEQVVLPIRALRYDVLFCVADMTPLVAWTPTIAIFRNLNIYDRRFYDNLRLRTLYVLSRLGARRIRRALFPTQAAADLIRRTLPLPEERVRVLPYGASQQAFAANAEPIVAAPGRRYLFTPAAVERHKNLGVAIESLRQLADPSIELWLVGPIDTDPAYVAELHALAAREGVADRVRFLGPVPYGEIQRYYLGAAAFVFPSEIETFGHPLVEAMVAGTAIVVSDIAAFRELAGDAARYFPPHDPRALARELDAVLADTAGSERERRRAIGVERAARLTWDRYADGLCAELRERARSTATPLADRRGELR
jgi:glycosyltransferase involved in cell wall biosynthesis